jgi:hypothetical protein
MRKKRYKAWKGNKVVIVRGTNDSGNFILDEGDTLEVDI